MTVLTSKFEQAYAITKRIEGGWHGATGVNAADRGGETFKGIARKFWPKWLGWKIIDALKTDRNFPKVAEQDDTLSRMVRLFYKVNFYDVNRLDDLNNQAIINELFDTGVNAGTDIAARFLQRGLNYLNRNGQSWANLTVDGKIGPKTIGTVNSLSKVDQRHLFNVLNVLQANYYIMIIDKRPDQEVFLRGWMERVELMES